MKSLLNFLQTEARHPSGLHCSEGDGPADATALSMREHRFVTTLILLATLSLFCLCCLLACGGGGGSKTDTGQLFELTIENIATDRSLVTSDGQGAPVAFSAALFAVHSGISPFYQFGQLNSVNGLESFAEAADPTDLIHSLQTAAGIKLFGIAQTPVGQTGAGLLVPGAVYKADLAAHSGDRLSLILSFLQANDVLAGSTDQGIPLFDGNGAPIQGDITAQFGFVDVGTEVNERPGEGPNQDPRQQTPASGTPESDPVGPPQDGFSYPPLSSVLRVTIAPI